MIDKRFILVALLLRVGCLFLPYHWSDDPYRYWWEGRVQNAGVNPFAHAPDSPALAHLRDANWERVAHKEVPTVYGPVLLAVFRLAAMTGLGPVIFKAIFLAADLALCAVLARQFGRAAWPWILSPLVILEFSWSGHEMSVAILFFMLGLTRRSPLWLGLAILTHLMALPLALAANLRERRWTFWLTLLGVVVAGYLPFAGAHLGTGLTHFAGRWRFNDSLFGLLVSLVGEGRPRPVGGTIWFSFLAAKWLAAGAVLTATVWAWKRQYSPARAALVVGGTLLLFSPVVHPWYVTWLLALVCAEFRWWPVVWSGTVLVSYLGDTGLWKFAQYAPVFATLTWEWYRASIRARWSQNEII